MKDKKIRELATETHFTFYEIKNFNNEFKISDKDLEMVLVSLFKCGLSMDELSPIFRGFKEKEQIHLTKFQTEVKHFCNENDFNANKDKLLNIRVGSRAAFINLLRMGSEITPAIYVCDKIFKLSTKTKLTEIELIELSKEFILINALLDEKRYN